MTCLPWTIVWKHFSHFSRMKRFSLPDSIINAFIAGSIFATRLSPNISNTSDKTSIAAPEIRDLESLIDLQRDERKSYLILLQWWMIRLVNSTALGVIAFVWSLAMSRIWTKNDYVISKVKITLWRCSIVVSQWVFESGSMSSASCNCALTLLCFFFSCGVLVLLVSGTGVSLTNDEYVRCTWRMRFIKCNVWVEQTW